MKHRVFSFINVIGLTIGLSASFVIGLMIYYDYTFDDFHEDGDRIYRVVTNFKTPEGEFFNSGVTLALEESIKDNVNFELVNGFYIERPSKVENKEIDNIVKWPNHVIYTSIDYFNLFEYEFLAGDKFEALSNPNSVILTRERAEEYFPKMLPSEIIGKTLVYNDSINISVTGVVENFKQRSDFIFQEFISHSTILQTRLHEDFKEKNWNNTNSSSQLFVKVADVANPDLIQKEFDALAEKHLDAEMLEYGQSRQFVLQPLSDIHFNEKYGIYDWSRGQASRPLLRNLALVAVFLLLLGCINFINLNTAQATQRAKEIGIRKTLGSSRKQLIGQFIGETFLLVIISMVISLFLSNWLITIFSEFVPEDVSLELFKSPVVVFGVLILIIVVTLFSGFYPAFVLSKFNTVKVLKNQLTIGDTKAGFRKFLTIFQFTIAQVFIIATLLVGRQINYLLQKDMGFKTDAIVSVSSPRSESELLKKELYAQKLRAIPQIKKVSIGGNPPASFSTSSTNATFKDGEKEIQSGLQFLHGDTNYLNVFELNLLAGRTRRNDTIKELVVNETFAKKIGFTNPVDAVGKRVILSDESIPIVGVMADFHQRSLKLGIEPMALIGDWYRPNFSQFQGVHIALNSSSGEDLKSTLRKIEDEYKTIYTEVEDYNLVFMDETIEQFYHQEEKISKLLNWSTGLSILISCLGLLGLVIYTTNRRVKEIGVRKVLGASITQLNVLLCKEFLILVAIAFLVASPIAFYGVSNWLQDFAYKTNISFWVFLLSGSVMIVFALLVISIKTLQAATSNPIKSLRTE